jgi:hypothetical protein
MTKLQLLKLLSKVLIEIDGCAYLEISYPDGMYYTIYHPSFLGSILKRTSLQQRKFIKIYSQNKVTAKIITWFNLKEV